MNQPQEKATRNEAEPGDTGSGHDTNAPKETPATGSSKFPREFGKYRLLRRLGGGGMGDVYLADDTTLQRQVAIKIPKLDDKHRAEQSARFKREARLPAQLKHPNICGVYEIGEIAGEPFLAVEYIAGQSLQDKIEQEAPLAEGLAVDLTLKLAKALSVAHKVNVIHRDLKPANVMLNGDNEPILMDFGLAVAIDGTRMTKSSAMMGTPAYMPPEQAMGAKAEIGPRSDQYSLGVILYELLTKQIPFDGETGWEILAKLIKEDSAPPKTHRPNLDEQLNVIVTRMIAKNANDRYPSITAVIEALEAWKAEQAAKDVPTQSFSALLDGSVSAEVQRGVGSKAKASSKPRWAEAPQDPTRRGPLVLGLGVLLVAVAAVVFLFQTKFGEIQIALSDPKANVAVKVDGETIDVTGLEKPLKLTVGPHIMKVESPDYETYADTFTVKRDGNPVFKVTLTPKAKPLGAAETIAKPEAPKSELAKPVAPKPADSEPKMLAKADSSANNGKVGRESAKPAPPTKPTPPVDAVYTLTLDPPSAALAAVGAGASVVGSGASRTVRVRDPDPGKPVALEVSQEGYISSTTNLKPTPGAKETLAIALTPKSAIYTVALSPKSATLTVDDREITGEGASRRVVIDKPDGKTRIQFKATAKGYNEKVQTFAPMPGERELFEMALQPKPALVTITLDPPTALLATNQGTFEVSTGAKRRLKVTEFAGDRTPIHLTATAAGYKEQLRIGDAAPGEESELAITLEKLPSPSADEVTNSIGMKLALIPAGEFLMGSADDDKDALSDEKPQHTVRLTKAFYLGKYEVTVGQFRAFVRATGYQTDAEKSDGMYSYNPDNGKFEKQKDRNWTNPGLTQTDDHPVIGVSHNDAVAFCQWLSKQEGKTYRLPTEAEWEYACRGKTTTRYQHGDDPEGLAKVGNVADASAKAKFPDWTWPIKADDGFIFTAPVGKFRPNAFGLYDMHGNVWEWCHDWYDSDYYKGEEAKVDPQGPLKGATLRVLRGGSWFLRPRYVRSSDRGRFTPDNRNFNIGFRVARTL